MEMCSLLFGRDYKFVVNHHYRRPANNTEFISKLLYRNLPLKFGKIQIFFQERKEVFFIFSLVIQIFFPLY